MKDAQQTTVNRAEEAGATASGSAKISVEAVRAKATQTLNTLFDFGAVWADAGIGYVRLTVENGARALERTAKLLEAYQARLKKDDPKAAA
jgi:hypothetical protein